MSSKNSKSKQKNGNNRENISKEEITEQITIVLEESKPATIRDLVTLIEERFSTPKERLLPIVRELEFTREITLQEPIEEPPPIPKNLKEFLFTKNYFSIEFYLSIIIIALVLILSLIDVREGIFFYARYVIVTFFMLILTGWALTAVIFPKLDHKLRFLERVATAIGMSIVILVLDGLFLNYTFGFNLLSIALSLTIITLICIIISMILRLKLAKDGFIFVKKEEESGEPPLEVNI